MLLGVPALETRHSSSGLRVSGVLPGCQSLFFLRGQWSYRLEPTLEAQLVKNPPAVQETLVPFLGWEDPLEKGQTTHSRRLGPPWWLSS